MHKTRIYFLLSLTLCFLNLHAQQRDPNFGVTDLEQLRKLQIAQMAIANLYVDSVDQEKLVEDAINGMLEKLDPRRKKLHINNWQRKIIKI